MKIAFDASGLTDLAGLLERARERPRKERAQALDEVVRKVAQTARANALSYGGTGELAASIEVSGTPISRRVSAPVRQAFFLEFGSPNTGAPRPWLSEPARQGVGELLDELGTIGRIW